MSITLEQLSAKMRQGEQVPLQQTAQIVLTLSIPSILQQIVVTAMEYIDAAMVGHIGASATASIGIVSSSTWLLHGMLAGLYMSFSIQVAQYLGADRQEDARGVLRQSMLFNLFVGLAAAAFGIGISRYLPGWLGADPALQADASAYFAIWAASLPFAMAMGTYSSMLRSTGDALTPGLISVLTCILDAIFNYVLINPTRTILLAGHSITVFGFGWGVPHWALRCPMWWAACWLWHCCCSGTVCCASAAPAPGASQRPACRTCGRWVRRWPPSVRRCRRRRCCWCASCPGWALPPLRPTAWA